MSYTYRKLAARGKVVPPKSVLTIDKEQADISWSFNFASCSSSNSFWQSGNNKRTYDSQCQIRKQNELSNVVVSRLGRAGAAKSREHVGNTRAGGDLTLSRSHGFFAWACDPKVSLLASYTTKRMLNTLSRWGLKRIL